MFIDKFQKLWYNNYREKEREQKPKTTFSKDYKTNSQKVYKKTLDKLVKMCYNISTVKETN